MFRLWLFSKKGCVMNKEKMTIQEMRALMNMSRARFSREYQIPIRTLENWESGARKAPDYVLHLL